MNSQLNTLAQDLIGKSLDDCNVSELKQLAQQYPYFGPVHLLLTSRLKMLNDDSVTGQYQKTSLYFPNSIWLDHLLSGPASVLRTNPAPVIEKELTSVVDHQNQFIETETVEVTDKEIAGGQENSIEEITSSNKDAHAENPVSSSEAIEEKVVEISPIVDTDHKKEDEAEVKTGPALPQLKITPVDSSIPLTFEPFHTVDYFASQGIKMKEENRPPDRFSQQLKSFTEWLKTMKRIPAAELEKAGNSTNEHKVEQMAAISITDREVVTEAMAEVWEKQGEYAKAREIYHKLSLLDPSKSAYFAAKIEGLK